MTPTAHHASVEVDLGERSYPVIIGKGVLKAAGQLLAGQVGGRHAVVVADEAVDALHRPQLEAGLKAAAARIDHVTVPAGEASKSVEAYGRLVHAILELGIDREAVLVALGGGVVGDLAGFAAASLLRGIDYVQVPTTLLAMVDSSVGGKTGINAPAGKNLVGAFHQPRAVLADTECLASLPEREMRAGYAEVVKYGLLGDAAFFGRLERELAAIMEREPVVLAGTIAHCCRAKAAIVAADEREGGGRALLNLGHTFGHAYEAEAGLDGSVLHGEAVAAGMVDAFRLAARLGHSTAEDAGRVAGHLGAAGLPTHRSGLSEKLAEAPPEALLGHMRRDKKARDGGIVLVLPHGIGDARIEKSVPEDQILSILGEGPQGGGDR